MVGQIVFVKHDGYMVTHALAMAGYYFKPIVLAPVVLYKVNHLATDIGVPNAM